MKNHPMRLMLIVSLMLSAWLIGGGCITHMQNPAATQPVTYQDLATTQPSYWMQKPAVASVTSSDFDRLWAAAEQVDRNYLFRLDRQDYRSGVLTTVPLVSAQWFEPWRRDVYTWHDRVESSIATIRRTIEFDFKDNPDGTYTATPKVLIERRTLAEIRVTSITSFRNVFVEPLKPSDQQSGTVESDLGANLPHAYWYALGRDPLFERALAAALKRQLAKP